MSARKVKDLEERWNRHVEEKSKLIEAMELSVGKWEAALTAKDAEIARLTAERNAWEAAEIRTGKALQAAESALTEERRKVRELVAQWREMAAGALTDGAIPGDIGHPARWHAVEICADELEQALHLTGEAPR